ncbi:zinc finger, CCHC-type containing protein, partial [Tanacetum coccineum]
VDLRKEFLSSKFYIKDMGEADVILGIKIKHESNRIAISQSYYVEKVLKKFNYFDCTLVSTTMDTSEKLMPNNGQAVSQLEYSRVIGCLMYVMTCTRPDIAFAVGKLSRYTSNPGTQHWQAIQQASKKQTCITGSTMESEFVALVVAGMEAEWLKNLLLKISSWSKPIAPISIRCGSAATLEKTYSQMYNGKSRHLGVKHSIIRELITNGVISIEFVRNYTKLGRIVGNLVQLWESDHTWKWAWRVYSEPLLWVSNPYLLPLPGYHLIRDQLTNHAMPDTRCQDFSLYIWLIASYHYQSTIAQRIEIGVIGSLIDSGVLKSKFFNHSASLPAAARATNSYSIIELVIQVYFLEAQEIAPCHGDEGGGESWRSLSIDLHNALSLQALQVTDTGCRLFPVVGLLFLQFPGQMTYPVASLTLDSARSYVMQGAPFTKRSISSIPIGGSISPEGFLPSILLMVFMVTVVIVAVILLACSIPIGWAYAFHQDKASLVKVPVQMFILFYSDQLYGENTDLVRVSLGPVFLLGLSVFAMVAACASRKKIGKQATTLSTLVGGIALTITSDEFYDEDGDFRKGDSIGVSMYLGGEILLGEERSLRNQTLEIVI